MIYSSAQPNRGILSAIVMVLLCCSAWTSVASTAGLTAEPAKSAGSACVLDPDYRSNTRHKLKLEKKTLTYTATAGSLTVSDNKARPTGRIFYISYTADNGAAHPRPLTFVFNGGPGAASAYLHMGALGPRRVEFAADGAVLPMPARLKDNLKSWLLFTDLVFVDPVGTGYSRDLQDDDDNDEGEKVKSSEDLSSGSHAWGVEEDADSLARFIRAYLSSGKRWLSAIYLAGESYGGFRAARLSRLLQSDFGIAPNGLVLISPALDFSMLRDNERSLWPWVSLLPSYSAVAAFHERNSDISYQADNPRGSLDKVEQVALSGYLTGLADGNLNPDWIEQTSRLTGLDAEITKRWRGRVPPARYVKALLADQQRLLSLYDASVTLVDPDPARQLLAGGDPYLELLNAPVTAAFNSYIHEHLDFSTDLPYRLLNDEIFESWNWRSGIQGEQGFVEAIADLKQAMSLNPGMRVLVVHGVFDLVTPYYASVIAIRQMALDPEIQHNIEVKVYPGGHMPYLNQRSLNSLFADAAIFYKQAN